MTDNLMRYIPQQVEVLDLSNSFNITDKLAKCLRNLALSNPSFALRTLNLSSCPITGRSLRYLKPVTSLRSLLLVSCKVLSFSLRIHILTTNLSSIKLENADLQYLPPNLTSLNLSQCTELSS